MAPYFLFNIYTHGQLVQQHKHKVTQILVHNGKQPLASVDTHHELIEPALREATAHASAQPQYMLQPLMVHAPVGASPPPFLKAQVLRGTGNTGCMHQAITYDGATRMEGSSPTSTTEGPRDEARTTTNPSIQTTYVPDVLKTARKPNLQELIHQHTLQLTI